MSDDNDEIKLTKEEEDTIIEDNKYLNKEFDIAEILAFGNIPEFENAADKFLCAMQVAFFVRKNGLGNHDNLLKYLMAIPDECRVMFLKQQAIQTLETMASNPKFAPIMKETVEIATGPKKVYVEDPPGFWSWKVIDDI